MPFALIVIGILIFVTAINGTTAALGSQLYKDFFTGSPSFIYWVLALLVVGLIGYIPNAKKPADAFMALIIVGMILTSKGSFFGQIQQALAAGPTAPANSASPLAAIPVQNAGVAASNSSASTVAGASAIAAAAPAAASEAVSAAGMVSSFL